MDVEITTATGGRLEKAQKVPGVVASVFVPIAALVLLAVLPGLTDEMRRSDIDATAVVFQTSASWLASALSLSLLGLALVVVVALFRWSRRLRRWPRVAVWLLLGAAFSGLSWAASREGVEARVVIDSDQHLLESHHRSLADVVLDRAGTVRDIAFDDIATVEWTFIYSDEASPTGRIRVRLTDGQQVGVLVSSDPSSAFSVATAISQSTSAPLQCFEQNINDNTRRTDGCRH